MYAKQKLKDQWSNALKQELKASDYVCENHFKYEDILREETFIINGCKQTRPFDRYILKCRLATIPLGIQNSEVRLKQYFLIFLYYYYLHSFF